MSVPQNKNYEPPQGGGIDMKYVEEFIPSAGLNSDEADRLLLQFGKNELENKQTPKVYISYPMIITWMVTLSCNFLSL